MEAADHEVLGVLAVPGEGADPVDQPLGLLGLLRPAGQFAETSQHLPFLLQGVPLAFGEPPHPRAGLEVLHIAEDHGRQRGGALAPPRPRDVDLANAAHAVLVQVGLDGGPGGRPARERGQLTEEVLVVPRALEKGHHGRVRADHVRDVEEREPHF